MIPISRAWVARILIGLVLFFNLQCAVVFLASPQTYAPGFQLGGVVGNAVVRGYAILFIMWNVPYILAFVNPDKYRVSLYEAVAMQALGLTGESILLATLPSGYPAIQATITRFVWFDGGGLLLLVLAVVWCSYSRKARI